MRCLLVCVCYNSHEDLFRYLRTVQAALKQARGSVVDIQVVDNSDCDMDGNAVERECAIAGGVDVRYLKGPNVGYFPAIGRSFKSVPRELTSYDYVIVSNVDLELPEKFFMQLSRTETSLEVGVIAPAIISIRDRRDLNPKIQARPSKERLRITRRILASAVLYRISTWLSAVKGKIRRATQERSSTMTTGAEIYAAHGSFFIFTRQMFLRGFSFDYPMFLFGEEIFVAEEARQRGLKIVHAGSIQVHDREHGSTASVKGKEIRQHHVESLEYITAKYF